MDPLAQLKDIQLPDEIHNYPIAFGWWLLVVICIALIIFISIKIIRHKQLRKAQRKALNQLQTSENNSTEYCVTLLKWAALQYFPRVNIANLHGEEFHSFLISTLPIKQQDKFKALSADSLHVMYKKESSSNNNGFHQASLLWLQYALPPKAKEKDKVKENKS